MKGGSFSSLHCSVNVPFCIAVDFCYNFSTDILICGKNKVRLFNLDI